MPFIFYTTWDLVKLADYLSQREDVDPSRIGITGESLGGMHAWFASATDTRYTVAVPIISVQIGDIEFLRIGTTSDCPIGGLEQAVSKARESYAKANSLEAFKLVAQPGIGHQMTPLMVKLASDWFDQHFTA